MTESALNRPTLVLNRNWQAIGVTTVSRSLVKVWNESARIVDPIDYAQYSWLDWASLVPESDEPCIVASRDTRLRVPEVITLTRYDRIPTCSVAFSRRNVFKRDKYTCQYCGVQPGSSELTIDHVLPRSHGGVSSWENCVLACVTCNHRKADRTPERAGMPLKKPPSKPTWQPSYSDFGRRLDSWSRFVSESYWTTELTE